MPTYDYQCDACDYTFELFQSISEPIKKKCPECGRMKLRRLFGTGAALLFKGSGFYQTDYRSESYLRGAEAEKKNAAGNNGSSDNASAKSNGSKKEKKPVKESSPA